MAKKDETEKAPKVERERANGVTKPSEGTITRAVWDAADAATKANKGVPATRDTVAEGFAAYCKTKKIDMSAGTLNTQYSRWVAFHGHQDALKAVRDAEKAEREAAKQAEKEEKAKARAEARAAREEEKAKAKAERDELRAQAKAEREAKKAADAEAKAKAKAEREAARAKAKAEKEAAKAKK